MDGFDSIFIWWLIFKISQNDKNPWSTDRGLSLWISYATSSQVGFAGKCGFDTPVSFNCHQYPIPGSMNIHVQNTIDLNMFNTIPQYKVSLSCININQILFFLPMAGSAAMPRAAGDVQRTGQGAHCRSGCQTTGGRRVVRRNTAKHAQLAPCFALSLIMIKWTKLIWDSFQLSTSIFTCRD